MLVENHSSDFGELSGLGILNVNDNPIAESKLFDVVIYRYFSKRVMEIAAQLSGPKAVRITYDQHPIDKTLLSKIYHLRSKLMRISSPRPKVRVSPVRTNSKGNLIRGGFYFKHPGPLVKQESEQKLLKNSDGKNTRVVIVAKRFNSRKKSILALRALEKVNRDLEVTLIQADPSFTGRFKPSSLERLYDKKLMGVIDQSTLKIKTLFNLSHEEMLQQFESCDIFLLPSKREPFSISNLEAASRGAVSFIRKSNGSSGNMPDGSAVLLDWPVTRNSIARQIRKHIDSVPDREMKKNQVIQAYEAWSSEGPWLSDVLRQIISKHRLLD
jgi:glycosyltransferase involved in cell wall biosynthesis